MGHDVLLVQVLLILLIVISGFVAFFFVRKKARDLHVAVEEQTQLKSRLNQIRLEKMDQDEKFQNLLIQEKTYKVAYEDWKAKYEWLDQRYQTLKQEFDVAHTKSDETKSLNTSTNIADLPIHSTFKTSNTNRNIKHLITEDNSVSHSAISGNELLKELKSILDQHLQIIGSIIGDEKLGTIQKNNKVLEPLHLIEGIDLPISLILNTQGIRTFEQLAKIPKIELKKWHIQFDEVEESLINSWPLQALAILNSKKILETKTL